jgi:hypothetical protein
LLGRARGEKKEEEKRQRAVDGKERMKSGRLIVRYLIYLQASASSI